MDRSKGSKYQGVWGPPWVVGAAGGGNDVRCTSLIGVGHGFGWIWRKGRFREPGDLQSPTRMVGAACLHGDWSLDGVCSVTEGGL